MHAYGAKNSECLIFHDWSHPLLAYAIDEADLACLYELVLLETEKVYMHTQGSSEDKLKA